MHVNYHEATWMNDFMLQNVRSGRALCVSVGVHTHVLWGGNLLQWKDGAYTFVCLGGPLPIVNRQKALVPPMACFRLFPRLIVTVKQPGKQCNTVSALSWKLGGQDFMSVCRIGMASAAIMACDFAISTGMVDQEYFNKHKMSNTDSWAASLPDLSAPTKWGMHSVAASEIWSLGKLVNITFKVLKTSSLIVAVDHNSLSSAAAKQRQRQDQGLNGKMMWQCIA